MEGFTFRYQLSACLRNLPVRRMAIFGGLIGTRNYDLEAEAAEKVKTFAVFRGVVHSVTGRSLQIASPKTSFANSGQTIIILDRSGRVVGKAKVALTYQTKITATLSSGDAQKGYSAEIYP